MTKTLHIGAGIAFPLDAITRTFGVLAQRGAGKTHTASVLVEEMLANRLPVVVLDPTGAWWGLRSSADGKAAGLPITIIGGTHGDLPLESTGGTIVADLAVDERVSLVLDLSAFSLGEQRRFVTDFAERLYAKNREPLHVVIDEADEFIPQRIPHGHERMVGAIDRIVRRGRIKGLGVTMISQRSAVIAKDVLTQIDTLIVLRTTGPQDRAAIDAWVSQNGTPQQRAELLESLSSLPTGTAWVWSPSWLGVFKRVQVRARTTFDSSATPRVGETARAPRVLASVDLEQIRARMSETVERAKADDPKELRRQLAEANRKIDAAGIRHVPERVEIRVPVLPDGFIGEIRTLVERLERAAVKLTGGVADVVLAPARAVVPRPTPQVTPPQKRPLGQIDGKLASGERKILIAAAQHPGGCTREQLTVLTGYKRSTRDAYIQRLAAAGHIDLGHAGTVLSTPAGRTALGSAFTPLPTGDALRAHWLANLPSGERVILDAVVTSHPRPISRDEISEQTGFKRSTRDAYLQRLHTRRLVTFANSGVHASELLFGRGAR